MKNKYFSPTAAKKYAIGGAVVSFALRIATVAFLLPLYGCASKPAPALSFQSCPSLHTYGHIAIALGWLSALAFVVCLFGVGLLIYWHFKHK